MSFQSDLKQKELRNFGFTMGVVVIAIFGVILPMRFAQPYPRWPLAVGAALIFLGRFFSAVLRRPYEIWMKLGTFLGWSNYAILTLIYYFVVTPVGICMRITGHNAMAPELDDGVASYRIQSVEILPEMMEDPF